MARYIDANALLEELQEELDFESLLYTKEQNEWFNKGLKCAVRGVKHQPTADVVETKRISEILAVLFENNIVEKYIPNTANVGSWEDFLRKACSGEYGMLR